MKSMSLTDEEMALIKVARTERNRITKEVRAVAIDCGVPDANIDGCVDAFAAHIRERSEGGEYIPPFPNLYREWFKGYAAACEVLR